MPRIDLTTRLSANPAMVFGTIDGDRVAMNVESGSYFHFNDTAGRVLELLEQPQTVGSVCDQLSREYRVEPEVCEREVLTLATALLDRGVLSAVE